MQNIKGYKAYEKGLICKGFKFESGKIYETTEVRICEIGFHFCINPFDCLNYYDISDSEFSEVESLGNIDKSDTDSKISTTKIKIGIILNLESFIKSAIDFIMEITKKESTSGNRTQIGTSGDETKIGTSGEWTQIGTSGDRTQIGTSGNRTQIGTSGNGTKIGTSGNGTKIGTSGEWTQIGTSGNRTQIGTSGEWTQIGTSGNRTQIGTSGDETKIGTSGDETKIGTSGYRTQIELNGKNSVGMCAGIDCKIKGKKGNWITLSEWEYDENKKYNIPIFVKSIKIDGKKIKEDTWYKLQNKKFIEVDKDGN